ncbi:MAG: peptidyl-prolyl cis-trans isomerase [Lentisphaeria bacterium]|nr:peptidyl-prolyl cis-trans isomerase [Lentisphaeria bacterium]
MRYLGAVLFFLCAGILSGAELPEIVARCGEMVVRREAAAKLLRQADPAERSRLSRRELLQKVLTDHFCSEALSKMLSDAGFPPGEAAALEMLKRSRAALPPGPETPDDGTLARLARDPKVQLKQAYRQYLQERRPDIFQVPPAVLERYYRENQQLFLLPMQIVGTRYTAQDPALLNVLQLRVRQGEKPESAARSIAGISAESFAGPEAAAAGVPAGTWSPVTALPGGGYRVYHVTETRPPAYLPLEKAAPGIREMMVRRRAALELEGALKAVFAAVKMEFFF